MSLFRRRDPRREPGAIVMDVRELLTQHESGSRYRLAGLLYTFPAHIPDRVDGQWPLILDVVHAPDGRRAPIVVIQECADGESPTGTIGHEAYPTDQVAIIPACPDE